MLQVGHTALWNIADNYKARGVVLLSTSSATICLSNWQQCYVMKGENVPLLQQCIHLNTLLRPMDEAKITCHTEHVLLPVCTSLFMELKFQNSCTASCKLWDTLSYLHVRKGVWKYPSGAGSSWKISSVLQKDLCKYRLTGLHLVNTTCMSLSLAVDTNAYWDKDTERCVNCSCTVESEMARMWHSYRFYHKPPYQSC